MIIQEVELFKEWLIQTLSPICNADAVTLSKYVVALVKKTLPLPELKKLCLDQLDVFLHDKCVEFVNLMFETLSTTSYIPPEKKVVTNNAVTLDVNSPADLPVLNETSAPTVAGDTSQTRKPNDVTKPNESVPLLNDVHRRRHSRSLSPRLSRRNNDRAGDDRRRRYDNRSRHTGGRDDRRYRSRSRSPRRSPARNRVWGNRDNRENRDNRPHRSPGKRSPMRRSPGKRSPVFGQRSRSKTPPKDLRNLITGKAPLVHPDSRGSTPISENGVHFDDNATPPPESSTVISVVTNSLGDKNRFSGPGSPRRLHMRCRDYDEKGYCMRGDMCPYDHGADPLVVEDIDVPSDIPYGPTPPGPPNMVSGPRGPPNLGQRMPHPAPPIMGPRPPPRMRFPPPPTMNDAYNPEDPSLTAPRSMRLPPPFWLGPPPRLLPPGTVPPILPPRFLPPPMQLEIRPNRPPVLTDSQQVTMNNNRLVLPPKNISVTMTTMSTEGPVSHPTSDNVTDAQENEQSTQKQQFDYNRLGNYRKPGYNPVNMTLEVRKIPREFNTILKLNEHFSKFGTLKNIQVSYDNDPEAALITFIRHCDAQSAYRSSDPLFQNRFIKVFWYMPKDKDENTTISSTDSGKVPTKTRITIPPSHKLQLNKKLPASESSEKSVTYTSDGSLQRTVLTSAVDENTTPVTTSDTNTSVILSDRITKLIKPTEAPTKNKVIKQNLEIQKQKQLLLEKYLEQQKLLISKLETKKTPEEKTTIMTTIKDLADKIDKLKVELAPSKLSQPKSISETKREMLDTELDLISKENSGLDTTDLRNKLNLLQKQAHSMGLMSRGRGRGARVHRGSWSSYTRGQRKLNNLTRTIDRRSKQLEVTGFKNEARDGLLPHLTKHGEVENISYNDVHGSALVTFKTRQDAEKATVRGIRFGDDLLKMRWHEPSANNAITNLVTRADNIHARLDVDDDIEDAEEIDEDALLAPDDDDIEESRSWRR